ncbi:hypothetical protein [Streptomyces tendae]|uniref:hypothetical protein n=1 Tax=Streptomyces tendae TaxID=1932 RepID=UPI003D70558F
MSPDLDDAQRRALEVAERLVRDLEANPEQWARKLLPEARRALRSLRAPKPPRRVRKSEEVLRHQQTEILRAVAVADATGDL